MKIHSTKQLERNTINSFCHVKEEMNEVYKILKFFRNEIRRLSIENRYLNNELRRLKLKAEIPKKEWLY